MKISALLPLVVTLFAIPVHGQSGADRIAGIDVNGTVFQVRLATGKVLSGHDLVGATLSLTRPGDVAQLKVRIESVESDRLDPDHEVLLYHMLAVDARTGRTDELCGPDVRGERWAFPVRGQWDAEGNHLSDAGYTLTCGDGAQGKCVRFGYKPWKTMPTGERLDAYYQACIRLVRADYCGGHGTTRDGMLIDIYDRLGIQTPDPRAEAAAVRFEAAWNEAGAVCVAHTRVPEHVTLPQLETEYPRLKGRLGDTVCSDQGSGHFGETVLMSNRSR